MRLIKKIFCKKIIFLLKIFYKYEALEKSLIDDIRIQNDKDFFNT